MNTLNQEEFAKHVLWHLAGLRADFAQFQSMFLGFAKMNGCEPDAELVAKWKKLHKDYRDTVYQDALQKVGLSASAKPPSDEASGFSGSRWN
jgi:hypothetical protein